ncbi:hypothetical protein YPPY08_1858, partial [Yersinia pestis PY-08]
MSGEHISQYPIANP